MVTGATDIRLTCQWPRADIDWSRIHYLTVISRRSKVKRYCKCCRVWGVLDVEVLAVCHSFFPSCPSSTLQNHTYALVKYGTRVLCKTKLTWIRVVVGSCTYVPTCSPEWIYVPSAHTGVHQSLIVYTALNSAYPSLSENILSLPNHHCSLCEGRHLFIFS